MQTRRSTSTHRGALGWTTAATSLLALPLLACSAGRSAPAAQTAGAGPSNTVGSSSEPPASSPEPEDPRYYEVVLVWIRDAQTFAEYRQKVAAVAKRYGALERSLAPTAVYAEGLERPDMLNVVWYESRDGVQALAQDTDFQRVEPLRSTSIDMQVVGGYSEHGEVSGGALGQRYYLVEIARFGPGGREAYRRYTEDAERAMAPHGYHVERVLRPVSSDALPFRPDVVKVAYFDSREGFEAFHRDPAHPGLEQTYAEVVAESIWLMGSLHPASLDP